MSRRLGSSIHVLALLLGLVLVATACGDGGGEPVDGAAGEDAGDSPDDADGTTDGDGGESEEEPADGGAEAAGEPEVAELTVGLLPLADVAPVFVAIEDGYFEDEGLTVDTQFVQGGAAAIPALVSGDLDFTFGNYVSSFLAIDQGIDLQLVAESNRAVPGFSQLMTTEDTGIEDLADLEGQSLAVNTLQNVAELAARSVLVDAGVDPDSVEYVEVPFPDMAATLDRGDVDAIFAVEPFATTAEDSIGAFEIANPYDGTTENWPVAGMQAMAEFGEANPETVGAFQRALIAATEATDEERATEIIPTYAELEQDQVEAITLPEFTAEIEIDEIQRVPDLMAELGLIDETIDASEHVIEPE